MATSMADLDEDFEKAKDPGTRENGLENLPDGEYVFEITHGEQKDTKSGPLVSFKLTVVSDGPFASKEVEHNYFLMKKVKGGTGYEKNDAQIAQLKKDLETLGFDVPNWTKANERPFSAQLKLAMGVIVGVQFKGKKKKSNEFHNLYLNERSKTDGRPEKFGPTELAEADSPVQF
ncbi:MAG TPA: hypothetical protein VGE74_20000 [Gemmata sp.]